MNLGDTRAAIANVERFIYRELGDAETEAEITQARDLQRLATGLRRKLETYPGVAATRKPPATLKE